MNTGFITYLTLFAAIAKAEHSESGTSVASVTHSMDITTTFAAAPTGESKSEHKEEEKESKSERKEAEKESKSERKEEKEESKSSKEAERTQLRLVSASANATTTALSTSTHKSKNNGAEIGISAGALLVGILAWL